MSGEALRRAISDALDPILADYVGPPIPHEAIAIVLDMAERAVFEVLTEHPIRDADHNPREEADKGARAGERGAEG